VNGSGASGYIVASTAFANGSAACENSVPANEKDLLLRLVVATDLIASLQHNNEASEASKRSLEKQLKTLTLNQINGHQDMRHKFKLDEQQLRAKHAKRCKALEDKLQEAKHSAKASDQKESARILKLQNECQLQEERVQSLMADLVRCAEARKQAQADHAVATVLLDKKDAEIYAVTQSLNDSKVREQFLKV
jgi:hypothetical protein